MLANEFLLQVMFNQAGRATADHFLYSGYRYWTGSKFDIVILNFYDLNQCYRDYSGLLARSVGKSTSRYRVETQTDTTRISTYMPQTATRTTPSISAKKSHAQTGCTPHRGRSYEGQTDVWPVLWHPPYLEYYKKIIYVLTLIFSAGYFYRQMRYKICRWT